MDKLKALFDSFYTRAGVYVAAIVALYDALPGLVDQIMQSGSGMVAAGGAGYLAIKSIVDKFLRGKE